MNQLNHTEPREGLSSAVCCICDIRSRRVAVDNWEEPDMWRLPQGWSTAPFPATFTHSDGSKGSTYTCPACNAMLRAGLTLPLRGGTLTRRVA